MVTLPCIVQYAGTLTARQQWTTTVLHKTGTHNTQGQNTYPYAQQMAQHQKKGHARTLQCLCCPRAEDEDQAKTLLAAPMSWSVAKMPWHQQQDTAKHQHPFGTAQHTRAAAGLPSKAHELKSCHAAASNSAEGEVRNGLLLLLDGGQQGCSWLRLQSGLCTKHDRACRQARVSTQSCSSSSGKPSLLLGCLEELAYPLE